MIKIDYQQIIEKSPIGFAIQKIICDHLGNPVDYEFIEVNDAFERYSGYQREDIIGKRITEIIPTVTTSSFDWIQTYGEVAMGGESKEFVQYSESLKKWYRVRAHALEPGYCVIFFTDVTGEMRDLEEKNILLTSINDIIFLLNKEFEFENVIVSDDTLLFIPREFIIGSKLQDIFSGELEQNFMAALHRAATSGQKEQVTYKSPIHGIDKWFTADIFYQENVYGVKKYIVSVREITQQKLVELELEQKKEELERFFNINIDLFCIADLDGNLVKVNPSWEKILGYSVSELEKRKFLDFVHPEDYEATLQTLSKLANNEPILYFVNRYICKDGTYRFIEWISQTYGKLIYAAARDITEHKLTEDKIMYLSFHDQLTGLYNRRFYAEELVRADVEENLPFSLIMADVNGLKLVNDAFGHIAGDALLITAAKELSKACSLKGIVSRIGGDEFVIILPRTDQKEAEGLVQGIELSLQDKGVDLINLSISFGVATKSDKNENIEDLFQKAEKLMYEHKVVESPRAKERAIKSILVNLYEVFPEEKEHAEKVSETCESIAQQLGLKNNELEELRIAGLVHDIGKISLNEKVLLKKEELTITDWAEIRRHAVAGYRILGADRELSRIAECVLHHHEHWDGSGYPDGLKGTSIPLYSRIIGIAEAYHAMLQDHSYRKAFTLKDTLTELTRNAGIQFDPVIVGVLCDTNNSSLDIITGGNK